MEEEESLDDGDNQNIKFDDDDDWNQEEEARKFPSDLLFI